MYLLRRSPYPFQSGCTRFKSAASACHQRGRGREERDRQTDRLSAIREEERDRSAVCHQRGSGRGRERQIGYLPIGEARSVVCPQRGRGRGRQRQSGYLPMREARSVVCHQREKEGGGQADRLSASKRSQIGCLPSERERERGADRLSANCIYVRGIRRPGAGSFLCVPQHRPT